MEITTLVRIAYYLYTIICCCCSKLVLADAIESPKYTIILSEPDFQIRLYDESSWMSARVLSGTSFEQSCKTGFHRLYEYIHGANSNSSKIAFTAPVLTSVPSSSSSGGNYTVRMYVSGHLEGKAPEPNPELKLQMEKWKTQCIAVRKFGGYAKDDNINEEIEALKRSLNKHLKGSTRYAYATIIQDTSSYTIAQYNASSRNTTGRLNEVWIHVSGPKNEC